MATATETNKLLHSLADLIRDEAYAEKCAMGEITPGWVDYQLQRIFHYYRDDYRMNADPSDWAAWSKWEAANQSDASCRKLAMLVAAGYQPAPEWGDA